MKKSQMRKVELWTEVAGWVKTTMGELRIGDKFRMFEPGRKHEPVVIEGVSEFVAKAEPELHDDGIFGVIINPAVGAWPSRQE